MDPSWNSVLLRYMLERGSVTLVMSRPARKLSSTYTYRVDGARMEYLSKQAYGTTSPVPKRGTSRTRSSKNALSPGKSRTQKTTRKYGNRREPGTHYVPPPEPIRQIFTPAFDEMEMTYSTGTDAG